MVSKWNGKHPWQKRTKAKLQGGIAIEPFFDAPYEWSRGGAPIVWTDVWVNRVGPVREYTKKECKALEKELMK